MKFKYIYIVFLGLALQSCFVSKNYNRPEDLKLSNQFRMDSINNDTISIAELSWKDFFEDEILQSYIERGLNNNIDVRIAIENISMIESYLLQAKAGHAPSINLGPNYSIMKPSGNGPSGNGETIPSFSQSDLTGSLSWEADIWGKIRSAKRGAVADYMRAVSTHQVVATSIISAIANTYYNLAALDEQKAVLLETIQNREEAVETNRALKEAGTVTEVAVKQNEALLLNAKELLVDTENGIRLNENLMSLLLGENPGNIERGNFANQNFTMDIRTGIPAQLLENRPDVRAAESALVKAFENVNIAQSNLYPALRITAAGGFQTLDIAKLFDPVSLFSNFAAGLAQPVYNRRALKTQKEVSQVLESQAFLQYEKALITASKEVSDAMFNLSAISKKADLQREQLTIHEQISDFSEDLLINGYGSYLDVILAKQNMLNMQMSIINTRLQKLKNTVELYRALGGGWK